MSIIISKNGKNAQRLEPAGFENEAHLQKYLQDNPESLPLDGIEEGACLLVLAREFPTQSGPIDALGIDERGNLYVIETKLYKNPDKRIVLAQIIDYGAALWRGYPDFRDFIDVLGDLSATQAGGLTLSARVTERFGINSEDDVADLWKAVEGSLREGKFRFVVLMDQLTDRLKDIIAYVNENCEFSIFGVELEYYRNDDQEILIPSVYGAESARKKTGGPQQRDKQAFLEVLAQRSEESVAEVGRKLVSWIEPKVNECRWGGGKKLSWRPIVHTDGRKLRLFTLWPDGRLVLNLMDPIKIPPFDGVDLQQEFLRRLNAGSGMSIEESDLGQWVERSLEALASEASFDAFTSAYDWMLGQLRQPMQ